MCPFGTYCWPGTLRCDPFATLGQTCTLQFTTLGTYCAQGLLCSPSTLKCIGYEVGTMPVGSIAVQEFQCASGIWNQTSKLCLDFAASQAQIQNVLGTTCTLSDQKSCNGISSACQCSELATGNTATCKAPITAVSNIQTAQRTQIAYLTAIRNAGCENFDLSDSAVLDPALCATRIGASLAFRTGMCSLKSVIEGLNILVCKNLIGNLGCSSLSGSAAGAMPAAVVWLLVAVAAFFTTQR